MTQISSDTVRSLAALSSLKLNDDEIISLQHDMERILEYVEQLNELDTSSVEPAYQVTGLKNVMRDDDVVESSVDRERLLHLAPASEKNQIKVPKVL